MHGELTIGASLLLGFLLTLVRVTGVFVFVPIPGISSALSPARIFLSLGVTIALFSKWPQVAPDPSIGQFVLWIAAEAGLGAGIGLAVGFVSEAFAVGSQVMALQAGYAFASTIDPMTQADSTVLATFSQLAVGTLFFATGLHREVIRIFARSLETYPAGSFVLTRGAAESLVLAGSMMFSTGLRLALPVVATLIMIDIAIALLGRINAQLHLGIIAFPAKMIVCLALLGWVAALFPALFRTASESALQAAKGMFTR